MPRKPLEYPENPFVRLAAIAKVAPLVGFLSTSLLAFNAAQLASFVLRPVAPRRFRKSQRFAANTWWSWCVITAEKLYGVEVEVSGSEIPMRENAIVVLNHQNMADITFLMVYARTKDRLGDLKWMVKDIIKYVPGVGWGMVMLDCVFVKRDWAADERRVRDTFATLRDHDVDLWLLSFSEGTRSTPEKIEKSQRYAREHGLPALDHLLLPRTKGFVATVEGLRDHVTAVYDVTIGYEEEGVPTLWQWIEGLSRRSHFHVRRYLVDELPADDEALGQWLVDRFVEKDQLLERFYREGAFPREPYAAPDATARPAPA